MIERAHTSKHYDQKLRALKDMLLMMGYHPEQMIADSIRALVERQSDIAHEVILRDDTLDRLELDVDRLCNEILALQHPVARDLRFVTTAFRIVRDIERIGDLAVNIAKRANELLQEPQLQRLDGLPIMAELTQKILSQSLDAFVNSDDKLAERVIEEELAIVDLNEQIFREMLTYMIEKRCKCAAGAPIDLHRQAPRVRGRPCDEHRGNGGLHDWRSGSATWNTGTPFNE